MAGALQFDSHSFNTIAFIMLSPFLMIQEKMQPKKRPPKQEILAEIMKDVRKGVFFKYRFSVFFKTVNS